MAEPLTSIGGAAMRALAPALAKAVRGANTPLDRELAICVREALADALEEALPNVDAAMRAEATSALSRGVIRVGDSAAMVLPAAEMSPTRAAAQQWWAREMELALLESGDVDPDQVDVRALASAFGRSLWIRMRSHAIQPGSPVTNLVLVMALNHLSEADQEPTDSAVSNLHERPRNRVFVGREGMVADLDAASTGMSGSRLVLTGPAGIGKSELASHLAANSRRKVVWWINAESTDGVTSGLAALAERLEIRAHDSLGALLDHLSRRDDFLLIFDAAPDEPSIARWAPDCRAGGTVLATSVSNRWGNSFQSVPVPPLDQSAAADVLSARVSVPRNEAAEIADALGGVPLALHQAAAFMATSGMSTAAYLEALRSRALELLERGTVEGYAGTATAAYAISRDRAVRDNSLASLILSVISVCGSGPVPPEILSAGTCADALAIADAVSALSGHGLVETNELGVSAHALTRLFVRADVGDSSTRKVALSLLGNLPEILHAWKSRQYPPSLLLPHIESLFARVEGVPRDMLLWEAAMSATTYLRSWGNSSAAEKYARRALYEVEGVACTAVGDNREGNVARLELARATAGAGRLDEALAMFREVLASAEGAEDWALAGAILNDISHHAETHGDLTGARLASEEALEIAQRLANGEDRDEALTAAYANRANLERSLGSPIESVKFLEKALRNAKLNAREPESIATISSNLGLTLMDAGRYEEAEATLRNALAIDEQELGRSHPSVARDLNNLGLVLYSLGDYEAALEVYERCLQINLDCHGEKHGATATAINNIGQVHEARKELAQAEKSFRRALEIHQELGGDPAAVATTLTNLGGVLSAPEQFGEAMQLLQQAYRIDCSVFGGRHIEVATDANNIGRRLAEAGMWKAALKWFDLSASIAEENVGRRHPHYAQAVASRALVYAQLGAREEALRDARESAEVLSHSLGPTHPAAKLAVERRNALEGV